MSTAPLVDGHRGDLQPAMRRRLAQLQSTMGEAADAPATTVAGTSATASQASSTSAVDVQAKQNKPLVEKYWFPLGGVLAMGLMAGVLIQGERTAFATETAPSSKASAKTPSPALTPITQAPAAAPSDDEAIRDTVERWRLDWSRRDVPAYLDHYSPRFKPAGGNSRADWEAQRRQALLNRPAIRVEVQGLRIERPNAQEARVHFQQTYLSGRYQETDQPKTLHLLREDGRWRIAGEWQGDGPTEVARKS